MSKSISKVAVVGTGVLGAQIATLSACFDYQVAAYDPDEQAFRRVHQHLASVIAAAGQPPPVSLEDWNESAEAVRICPSLAEALQDADLVIEASPENLESKRRVFAEMDALAPPRAILATNSSSIPISRIESATGRPERCLNIHFYFPVLGSTMVDVMGGARTTAEVFETGKDWVRSIGCVPLTVKKESLGFCFNRVWRAIKKETLHMWADGFVDFQDVDRAWMLFSGMPYGPFGLMDNVGLDVVYGVEMVYYNESRDPRDHPPRALKDMIDRGELGAKTGRGFYIYPDPDYARPDFLKS
ncbi:MAG: 3-hydroxyacyl-CoA dehydrogenase family protein [Proteobacteria bacterium]|nr:3-hydroxyacyl-CoA dehydrogenase family protein [Pseudomonadota bacterium]